MRTIELKVKPNARTSRLTELEDGSWLAEVRSPPVDGKANQEVIGLVAHHWAVAKARVSIASGASGRRKRIRIDD